MSVGWPELNLATACLLKTLLKPVANVLLKIISALYTSEFCLSFATTLSPFKPFTVSGDSTLAVLFPDTLLTVLDEKL